MKIIHAEVIYVGPGEKFESIHEAQNAINDGDVIEIVPGVYKQCASFKASNLVIRPKGWPKQNRKVRFQDVTCEGKAIFVIYGDNFLIEGIEFANARVPDENGAGIKFYGDHLILQDTYFLNNEMGLLTGPGPHSKIIIYRSKFESNGKELPLWGHGVYVGKIKSLMVIDSVFKKQKTGHHIKSRAAYTEVVNNNIFDEQDGNASYAIDISNGGSVLIEDNIIQKGPLSDNPGTAICLACEGGINPTHDVHVRGNLFTNDTRQSVVFVRNLTGTRARFENNVFKGAKTQLVDRVISE